MVTRQSMINLAGDHEESVERLSKHLGKDKLRRKLFNTVYGRGRKPRSLLQIMADAGIKMNARQQAQNQIDHLAKHHLICRMENDRSVNDRSHYLYYKDASVRAVRAEIVRYADDQSAARRLPTKRRPAVQVIAPLREIRRSELKKKAHLNVLYLTADPYKANPLRVDAEVRRVQEVIRSSEFRDNITVDFRPAAGLRTLLAGLNERRPQIVHFSGHGNKRGIAMDNARVGSSADESVAFGLLAKAIGATDTRPRIIVLNACESSAARKPFLKLGLIVISMRTSISDGAAVAFAPVFYAAIAAGQSVKAAFEQGAVAVEHGSISEADTPQLFNPPDINPASVKLT